MEKQLSSNPTSPLELENPEIALMTREEFLEYRNPDGRFHASSSYDSDLKTLNNNYKLVYVGKYRIPDGEYFYYQSGENYLVYFRPGLSEESELVAVIYQKVVYFSNVRRLSKLDLGYTSDRDLKTWVSLPSDWPQKRVKYLQPYVDLVQDTKNRNLADYPYVQQRLRSRNRAFEIRSEKPLELNRGITLVVLDVQSGLVVAKATDEWGATLLRVAEEYRGWGLGKLLGQIWYHWNPEYTSGGFTSSGEANAIAVWAERVRDFLAQGWYSELIKSGKLSKQRLKLILSDLPPARAKETYKPVPEAKKRPLVMLEKDEESWGPGFLVYDERFLEDPDEKYIYGFGFFRDSEHVGTFLYSIDYEPDFAKLTTYLALQIARNNQEEIYVGPGYGDLLEIDGLEDVIQRGNYVRLTQDVLDLERLRRQETLIRRKQDSLGEKYHLLLEMAHAKWDV